MAPSTIPFVTIPEIPLALRVDQWASLLHDLPLVSAEMPFKKNDKVCVRQVHEARSVPPHVWANTIYDTEYVISKPGRRQKQTILKTPELQYIPNMNLSLTPGGTYPTEPLENDQIAHVIVEFEYQVQGTKYQIARGTRVKVLRGPVTKKGSASSNPRIWHYKVEYSLYDMEDADAVYYPLAVRGHLLSGAVSRPAGKLGRK